MFRKSRTIITTGHVNASPIIGPAPAVSVAAPPAPEAVMQLHLRSGVVREIKVPPGDRKEAHDWILTAIRKEPERKPEEGNVWLAHEDGYIRLSEVVEVFFRT